VLNPCTGLVLTDLPKIPMNQGEAMREIGNDDGVALRWVCLCAGGVEVYPCGWPLG
jgi:hypothetical protein